MTPVVHSIIPNQNVMMAKRAFYTVQTAVSELINDPACYPDKTQAPGSERRIGFDDGYGYENCIWGNDEIPDTSELIEREGNSGVKFGKLLAYKLGDDITVNGAGQVSFNTSDGMSWLTDAGYWYHGSHDWGATAASNKASIFVDLDGASKGNNCNEVVISGYTNGCNGKAPDQILFKITAVSIDPGETWAVEAVKANASITGK